MGPNIPAWRAVLHDAIDGIADEELQRRSWLGLGPEIFSPDEMFNQFFDDAAVEDFLVWPDTGLTDVQREALQELITLMRDLSHQTPNHVLPQDLIEDERLRKIRPVAARVSTLLAGGLPTQP